MKNALFTEDQKKIENAVQYYPLGSCQIGEIAMMSAKLYEKGIDAEKQLKLVCDKYSVSTNEFEIKS
ncbi:hypothetical protein [Oceanobacillus kimchii]|uniref:Uncharacterized protein n=1 Tax=Oceanobacillus kimchii TaxID=746691 RepID=A0ABQ5TM94_9BACI|nr:hypothetical protein [Oceanobacillus kimchii]GLO66235.1 hypothetical protein MACH08_20190 [Oceanobacillus kimchii]